MTPDHSAAANTKQGYSGCEKGGEERHEHGGPVIEDWYGQMEGEHPDVVHRPNAESHRGRPTCQPDETYSAARGRCPPRKIERGVSSTYRHHDREGNQAIVVGTSHWPLIDSKTLGRA